MRTVDGDTVRAQHVCAKMGFTQTRLIPGSLHNAREMECVLVTGMVPRRSRERKHCPKSGFPAQAGMMAK